MTTEREARKRDLAVKASEAYDAAVKASEAAIDARSKANKLEVLERQAWEHADWCADVALRG